jgi:hypothetical protein
MRSSGVRLAILFGLAAIAPLAIWLGAVRRPFPLAMLAGVGYLLGVSAIGAVYQDRLSDSAFFSSLDWGLKFAVPALLVFASLWVRTLRFAGVAGLVLGLLMGAGISILLLDVLDLSNVRLRL